VFVIKVYECASTGFNPATLSVLLLFVSFSLNFSFVRLSMIGGWDGTDHIADT